MFSLLLQMYVFKRISNHICIKLNISSLCLKICNAYSLNENFHYIITFPGQKNKREVVLFKCRVVLKHSMDVDGKVHMKKFRSYAGVSDEDRKITT